MPVLYPSPRGFLAAFICLLLLAGCDSPEVDLDQRATALADALGPMCLKMDFQAREQADDGAARPVWCSRPNVADDEHPEFTVVAFTDGDAKDEWVGNLDDMPRTLVDGHDWIVLSDLGIPQDARARLTEASGP